MNTVALAGEPRKIFGRKVKALRREGIIPAHIFGHKIKTIHVQIPEKEFSKISIPKSKYKIPTIFNPIFLTIFIF